MNVWLGFRSDSVVAEIALGGLEKEDKELHQLDRAVFSKVTLRIPCRFTSALLFTLYLSFFFLCVLFFFLTAVCILPAYSCCCSPCIAFAVWHGAWIVKLLPCVLLCLPFGSSLPPLCLLFASPLPPLSCFAVVIFPACSTLPGVLL